MKKLLFPLIAIIALLFWLMNSYNGLIQLDENVNQSWSQVENVYQRRSDLVPNLVATVQGFADQERETLTAVVQARAQATQTNVDINDAASLQQFQQAQGQLGSALSRLLVTVEAYPNLNSNVNFLELQAELAGTENRITVERQKYNQSVQMYNARVRRIPTVLIANILGFPTRREYFEAQEGADVAPTVDFSTGE